MNVFETVLVDMGIDLSRGYISVAQHKLYGAEIGAMGQHMGGKRMAQHVGGDVLTDTGGNGCFPENLPETQASHGASAIGDKESVAALAIKNGRSGGVKVTLQFFSGGFSKRDQSFLVAFAEDADKSAADVAGHKRQLDEF